MEVLWDGRAHARAEPPGHHHCCQIAAHECDGWGARIRTWDRGTKTRCLTTWLRPTGLDCASALARLLACPSFAEEQHERDRRQDPGADQRERSDHQPDDAEADGE